MNIVYLSHTALPSRSAHSVQIMKMCRALVSAGHHVELIASGRSDAGLELADPYEFYGVDPVFPIHRVRWFAKLPGKYYLYALASALKALRLRGYGKQGVIYSRYLFAAWTAARLGAPVVFESHADEFNWSSVHRRMIRQLARSDRCLTFIVISDTLRRAYLERFPGLDNKIMVAHDGADLPPVVSSGKKPDEARPGTVRQPPPRSGFTAGYIGQLYPGKGMEIISELVEKCPDVRFQIVGGTEKDVACWNEKLQQAENIEFTGFVAHSQTAFYLQNMDVVLAPYQRNVHVSTKKGVEIGRWMSPMKIFEYMSAQKPIVSSDLPVLREILQHNRNALLCSPAEAGQWADAIYRLKNDPGLGRRLAGQARADLQEFYSWEIRAAAIVQQIEKAMQGK